jgi:hypothetical protein
MAKRKNKKQKVKKPSPRKELLKQTNGEGMNRRFYTRVVRDKSKYRRKRKHQNKGYD